MSKQSRIVVTRRRPARCVIGTIVAISADAARRVRLERLDVTTSTSSTTRRTHHDDDHDHARRAGRRRGARGAVAPALPLPDGGRGPGLDAAYRAKGARPEFADPGPTALAFARFLGYTEVDRVTGTTTDAKGAHVSVGSLVPETQRASTAAVVHLVRYLPGGDAPWEVVGTDDTTFSLTAARIRRVGGSPLAVGGRITGVDESIRVQVRQLHGDAPLGEQCCLAAGGDDSPWSGQVTFSAPDDPILMVAASTGGHVRSVERFTVNGVRRRG